MEDFAGLVMDILKNKEEIIKTLFADIETCSKTMEGTKKILPSILTGSEGNLRQQLKNALATNYKLAEMQKRMLLLMLIVLSSDDFSSMTAKTANKLGKGKEALQELFKQKLKGGD